MLSRGAFLLTKIQQPRYLADWDGVAHMYAKMVRQHRRAQGATSDRRPYLDHLEVALPTVDGDWPPEVQVLRLPVQLHRREIRTPFTWPSQRLLDMECRRCKYSHNSALHLAHYFRSLHSRLTGCTQRKARRNRRGSLSMWAPARRVEAARGWLDSRPPGVPDGGGPQDLVPSYL